MDEELPNNIPANPGDDWQALGEHMAAHPDQYHDGIKPIIEGLVQQHTAAAPSSIHDAAQALRTVPLDRAADEARQAVDQTGAASGKYVRGERAVLMMELSDMAPELADEAFDTAAKIEDRFDRARVAEKLVPMAVATDKTERCLDLFDSEEERYDRDRLLEDIAVELAHNERPDEAIAQAGRITSVYSRVNTLIKILDDHPEKAPEIHVAVLDTSKDAEVSASSEDEQSRIRGLISLADHLPEAVKEATDRINAIDSGHQFGVEELLEFSKHEPSMASRAAEKFAARNHEKSYSPFGRDQETMSRQQDLFKQTVLRLADQGHISEAFVAADAIGRYQIEDIAIELANSVLSSERPERVAELAEKVGGYKGVALCKDVLARIQDPETRTRIIDQIRRDGRLKDLAFAAQSAPELISEVETLLQKESSYFDKRDAQTALFPAYLAVGRQQEVLKLLDEESSGEAYKLIESLELPANLELAKEIANNHLSGDTKAMAFAKLASFYPEAAADCLRIIDEEVAPEVAKYREKERHESRLYQSNVVQTVKLLAEAGFIDEATQVSELLVTVSSYTEAVSDFAHLRPDILPSFVKSVGRQAKNVQSYEELQDVASMLTTVLEKLSDDQVLDLIPSLSEMQSDAIRLVAADAVGHKLIVGDRSQDLLKLLPDELSYRLRTDLPRKIAAELVQSGELDAFRVLANRFSNETYDRINLLSDMVEIAPELAPDLWQSLQEEIASSSRYVGQDLPAMRIAALVPEAADYVMSSLREDIDNGADESVEIGGLIQKVEALVDAGRAAEALAVVGSMYRRDRLLSKIVPRLIEHGDINIALDTARGISDTFERARALASLVPRDREPAQKAMLHELLGETGVTGGAHVLSDRSINVGLFTNEIAKDPLLIETFLSRATSPAELLVIMKTVDAAAEMAEHGDELRFHALKFLQRFETATVLSGYWKEGLQLQALGGEKADHQRFKNLPNLKQLAANLKSNSAELVRDLLKAGYGASDLFEYPWLLNGDTSAKATQGNLFPVNGAKSEQHTWLADNAFVELQGFSRRQIGQILAGRLGGNLEYSLHDASQWLQSFQIKSLEEIYNPETGQLEEKQLISSELERQLLGMLVDRAYSPEELRRLPGFASASGEVIDLKTQKFGQLFHDPANAIVYAAMLQELAGSETGKIDNVESLDKRINDWVESGVIDTWLGQSKEIVARNETLAARASSLIGLIMEGRPNSGTKYNHEEVKIPNILGQLSAIGKARKEYVDSTTTWLKTYQNLAAQKLERVWGERQKALAAGIVDHPNDIYEWSLSSGLREYLSERTDGSGMLQGDIPAADMMTRFKAFVPELVTRYDSRRAAEALTRLWHTHNPEADLSPLDIVLPDGYTFKVFSKDDPAGMTIGFDTDCCMTLDGASESCIYAGYTDPRFGFVGLYDQDDKLVAQSFVWHNEGTLVLDNIEGQRGRNLSDIQQRYKTALTEYLARLHQEKPELGITTVNMGTGYLNSQLSMGLDHAEAVRLPDGHTGLYTDARDQVRLLSISETELAQFGDNVEVASAAIESQPEREARPEMISISSPLTDSQTISNIEAQVYPSELVVGRGNIRADLERPKNFSFLIGSRNGNGGTVGYTIAYHDDDVDGVYVSDLALLSTEQRGGYGVAALDYLLDRVTDAGEHRIVFDARETTSYLALQSERATAILAKHGYRIVRSQHIENHFDNGEGVYQMTLEIDPVMAGAESVAA